MTTVLGSTHVVQQLSFSMFLSILTFNVDLILGSFLTFWGPNGLFLGSGFGLKTVFELHIGPENSQLGPKKVKHDDKIESKSNVRNEGNIENESCAST